MPKPALGERSACAASRSASGVGGGAQRVEPLGQAGAADGEHLVDERAPAEVVGELVEQRVVEHRRDPAVELARAARAARPAWPGARPCPPRGSASTSSAAVSAVSARIGISGSSARICVAASSPPRTGIRRSSRIASKPSARRPPRRRPARARPASASRRGARAACRSGGAARRRPRPRARWLADSAGTRLRRRLDARARPRRSGSSSVNAEPVAERGDDGHVAAHRARQPARDAEPEPGAGPRPGVAARPRLEQPLRGPRRRSPAGVADRDPQPLALRRGARSAPAPRSVYLTALLRQVEHDLAHPRGVAVQRVRHLRVDVDAQLERRGRAGSGAARRRSRSAAAAGRSRRPRPRRVRPRRARRRARRAAARRATARRRRSPRPARARARGSAGVDQQLRRARDARQRRLDLVAHRGQELALLLLHGA